MSVRFAEIGRRLRAYRLGRGLSADEIAEQLGLSRAAVYRIEAGEVVKIETLERLAGVLETTVASLLGAGVEYYATAVGYFERMRQIEEQSDQVIAHFAPMSYLLTSDEYPAHLRQTLVEAIPSEDRDAAVAEAAIDQIVEILNERRRARQNRGLSVINFVSLPELERWLKIGVVGRFDLPQAEIDRRRRAARAEVEHLARLLESERMGVQIALLEETLPNTAFQIFRSAERTYLGLSPFRLGGELPNVRTGIAMLTADVEPVRLYEHLIEDLWRRSQKGAAAVGLLRAILARSGIEV